MEKRVRWGGVSCHCSIYLFATPFEKFHRKVVSFLQASFCISFLVSREGEYHTHDLSVFVMKLKG